MPDYWWIIDQIKIITYIVNFQYKIIKRGSNSLVYNETTVNEVIIIKLMTNAAIR